MNPRLKILISNDDGVLAPGINVLTNALVNVADIEVMAPDRNRSGASNSLTLSRPLLTTKLANGYYSVEGTPTDCVHLALTGFFDTTFDMVVSGINDGANLGDDVIYSGTVAAAMEGRHLGLPAIAVSMAGTNIKHYESAATIISRLISTLSKHSWLPKTILNINVPDLPLSAIKGIKVTRLGARHNAEPVVRYLDPRGNQVYWVGSAGGAADAIDGTDFFAINQDMVSITPLHIDMTQYNAFSQVSSWAKGILSHDYV